jgi:hypothetical protein
MAQKTWHQSRCCDMHDCVMRSCTISGMQSANDVVKESGSDEAVTRAGQAVQCIDDHVEWVLLGDGRWLRSSSPFWDKRRRQQLAGRRTWQQCPRVELSGSRWRMPCFWMSSSGIAYPRSREPGWWSRWAARTGAVGEQGIWPAQATTSACNYMWFCKRIVKQRRRGQKGRGPARRARRSGGQQRAR